MQLARLLQEPLDALEKAARQRTTDRQRPFDEHEKKSPGSKGRPHLLTVMDVTALALRWLCTRHRHDDLALEFGVVRPTISRHLKCTVAALLTALRTEADASICLPGPDDRALMAGAIAVKYGPCPDPTKKVFGVIDGTFLEAAMPPHEADQRSMYSGKEGTHGFNNVFLSTPDGCIVSARVAYPGSQHDQTVAAEMLADVRDTISVGEEFIVGDAGFAAAWLAPFILRPLMNGDVVTQDAEGALRRRMSSWVTSVRQGSEWINHSLKQTFLRLTLRLPHEKLRAAMLIEICVRLHNLRARWEGIGQMRTVYRGLMDMRVDELRALYLELQEGDGVDRNDVEAAAVQEAELDGEE
jgi:hypothetical protein